MRDCRVVFVYVLIGIVDDMLCDVVEVFGIIYDDGGVFVIYF